MNEQYRRRFIIGIIGLIAASAGIAGGYGLKTSANHRRIADYIRNHAVRKLQIGAGGAGRFTQFSDWLNTDVEPIAGEAYLDATKPFPIPDGALSIIFSEQVSEHLSYRDGLAMLRESYGTLNPGGKIRIATPNLLSCFMHRN